MQLLAPFGEKAARLGLARILLSGSERYAIEPSQAKEPDHCDRTRAPTRCRRSVA